MTQDDAAPVGRGDVIVGEGDCLDSIAFARGFYYETVWNHPENRELKDVRKDPFVLRAGDRVFVPEITLKEVTRAPEQRHVFRRKGVPARFTLVLKDGGKVRANEPYRLLVEGRWQEGRTNGEGLLTEFIPPNARSAVLLLGEAEERYEIQLGHVDPIDLISGVQDRLRNLGYYLGESHGILDDATLAALSTFKAAEGLAGGDSLDDATRDALKAAHGN